MVDTAESKVESADRIHEGLLITFDDGRCAVFSHALLRESLAKAVDVPDIDDDLIHEIEFDRG